MYVYVHKYTSYICIYIYIISVHIHVNPYIIHIYIYLNKNSAKVSPESSSTSDIQELHARTEPKLLPGSEAAVGHSNVCGQGCDAPAPAPVPGRKIFSGITGLAGQGIQVSEIGNSSHGFPKSPT